MKPMVVIGGGGHAKVIVSLVKKLGRYRLLGFTDQSSKPDLLEIPYLGDDRHLEVLIRDYHPCYAALGLGNTGVDTRRSDLAMQLTSLGFKLPALISPSAVVNEDVSIGDGTVVLDGAIVGAGARIGSACILNTGCIVDHDCRVGDGVHLAPGCVLSGGVEIGRDTFVGAGAVIIHYLTVADRCLVGAGATVTRALSEPGVYLGTPARRQS